jgi:uncharacterized protein
MEIATPAGPALVELDEPADPAFLLLSTHAAGGGVQTPDLLAVRAVALGLGGAVAGVLQPYRVAGRRAPGPAPARTRPGSPSSRRCGRGSGRCR